MKHLLCFSHLRWDFVYQRPQHLLSRFAKTYHVYYFEEPLQSEENHYEHYISEGVHVIKIYTDLNSGRKNENIQKLIGHVLDDFKIGKYLIWYYTPMALEFTSNLVAETVIYDSMDELSAFKFADENLKKVENELFQKADVVFTGGHSLFQAKKHRHHNIHAFPSSIDKSHFSTARNNMEEPEDQINIPHPKLGFFGVVDERFDTDMLKKSALLRPDWHFVIIGPVVKIDYQDLPQLPNIHYLGARKYADLPAYISHWDLALILFANNASTEFISPTKTPEYLAAGLPVISTPITDVINPYGKAKLVHIAETAEELVGAAEAVLSVPHDDLWLKKVDDFLEGNSWDATFKNMCNQIDKISAKDKVYV